MAHNHAHDLPMTAEATGGKAFYISIALNVAYVLVEIFMGLANNSMALLTDAGHNVSDVGSLLLSLIAFRLAKKRPSGRYTYGYKKTTVLAAFGNACLLLVAVGVLGFETVRRFLQPSNVEGVTIAWVAGIGIVVNSLSAFLFFKDRKQDLNVKGAYLHLLADALVSVGVVIAGVIIHFTGWYILDPIIGLVVLVVILVSTWGLLVDSFQLAVDAVPKGIDLDAIKKTMGAVPHVKDVKHVHIWAMSTTETALTAQVHLAEGLSQEQSTGVVEAIKHELEHHRIGHSTIEINRVKTKAEK